MFKEPKNKKTLFVLDIETIGDVDATENLCGKKYDKIEEGLQALKDYHLKLSAGKSDFFKLPYHKVVCFSFLEARIEYDDQGHESYKVSKINSASVKNMTEEQLIAKFWEYTTKTQPLFVTFNGRSFDLPVLKYRGLKYGLSMDYYFQDGGHWENYYGRYSCLSLGGHKPSYHFDILDAVTEFGSSEKVRMQDLANILDVPCKLGNSGSSVEQMFLDGKIDDIVDYCETDVLCTYIIFLKWMKSSGRLSGSLRNHFEDLLSFLQKSEHLKDKTQINEFLTKWKF
jgi:predicted PolB exonuclease-like 3'-5' exonuclease